MSPGDAYFAGLGLGPLLFALATVFLAALVRGTCGFGLAALVVTSLTLILPPAEVVPLALVLELLASLAMLRQVWRRVAWRGLTYLWLGAALALPLGVVLLASLPAQPMRLAILLFVLAASLLIWHGVRLPGPPGPLAAGPPGPLAVGSTGVISGLANGAAATGGLPVVLLLFTSPSPAAVTRATVVVYLLGIHAFTLVFVQGFGLVNFELILRSAVLTLPLAFGLALGSRRFLRADPESFRRFALILLVFLSILGLLRMALA